MTAKQDTVVRYIDELEKVGGLKVFEGVDPANPYVRAEMIQV